MTRASTVASIVWTPANPRRAGGIIGLNHSEMEEVTCLLETMTGWP